MTIREQLRQAEENWLPEGGTWEGAHEYVLPCRCGRVKFSWNVNKKVGNCFRCGFKLIGLRALRSHFGTTGGTETAPSQSWSPGRSQSHSQSSYLPVCQSEQATAYLQSRGVSPSLAEEIGILYKDERVWLPLTSPFGLIPFLLGRSINPDSTMRWTSFPGEKGRYVFGKSEKNGPVVLVEGVFDVLSPGLWGKAICLLGSKPSSKLLSWIASTHTGIFLWMDPDEAGKDGTQSLTQFFSVWWSEIPLTVVSSKKLNRSGKPADPGDHSPAEAMSVLREHGWVW